jgi:hypothetical protein
VEFHFSPKPSALQAEAEARSLEVCNRVSGRFGLTLTPQQMQVLTQRRFRALRDSGRVEFGDGVLEKLVLAFCDSPYLSQGEYEETLAELQDLFYWFKNESEEQLSDDELIGAMKAVFDGRAQGSTDYLAGLTPGQLREMADGRPSDAPDAWAEEDDDEP